MPVWPLSVSCPALAPRCAPNTVPPITHGQPPPCDHQLGRSPLEVTLLDCPVCPKSPGQTRILLAGGILQLTKHPFRGSYIIYYIPQCVYQRLSVLKFILIHLGWRKFQSSRFSGTRGLPGAVLSGFFDVCRYQPYSLIPERQLV